jgi:hypothetical protein
VVVDVVGTVLVVEVVGADEVDVDVPVEWFVVLVVDPAELHPLSTIATKAADPRRSERLDNLRRPAYRLMKAPSGDRSCHRRGSDGSQGEPTASRRVSPPRRPAGASGPPR